MSALGWIALVVVGVPLSLALMLFAFWALAKFGDLETWLTDRARLYESTGQRAKSLVFKVGLIALAVLFCLAIAGRGN